MHIDVSRLPRDPDALIKIIQEQTIEISLLDRNRDELSAENEKLKAENLWYRELIEARNRRLFGRTSEKLSYDELQHWLFNEAEVVSLPLLAITAPGVEVKAHTRHKGGRKPISDKLPRKIEEHTLSESEKKCAHCGKERPRLAPDIHEEVEMVPAKVYVTRHVYEKVGPCKALRIV